MQRPTVVWLGILANGVVFGGLAELSSAAGETIRGERIDPSTYGPSVVESMEEVIARDAQRPAQWFVDPKGRNGQPGTWVIPSRRSTTAPHSGNHHVVNKWGDTRMGITFPEVVDVNGAFFAGQAGEGAWTTRVRAIGYRDGAEVERTDWFDDIGAEPSWFEIDLCNVDRIVIEAQPVIDGGGWYAMDDFTYTHVEDDGLGALVLDFEELTYRTSLTGSRYAGLIWEAGEGDFNMPFEQAIHHPMVPPGLERDEPDAGDDGGRVAAQDGGTLPELVLDFQGAKRGDAGSSSYPPDTDGAIGPDHYVITVNRVYEVHLKDSGTLVSRVNLSSFLPGGSGDPRVLFDQHSGRWIVIDSDFSSRIYLAVSKTNNPTGAWFKNSFPAESGEWADYPTLGVDEHGVYITAYMVGGGFGMTIFALDKAPLVAPVQSLGTITAFPNLPWEGAIQPVHTYGTPPGQYFVSRRNATQLRVRRLNPPITSPTLTELGNVEISYHAAPPDAPALGSSTPLDTVGDRLMMAVYRDGSIWTAHTVKVSGKAACRWYEFDPETLELFQEGTVTDGTLHYYFPAIMVNIDGNAVMGFTGSSSAQYASAYYTGRLAADPPNEMAPPAILKAGNGPQNNIDGYGRNRWGDYSYTTLDPVGERIMWTIQEYGHSTNYWGTWVGALMTGDCNRNGLPDEDDVAGGFSPDADGNGVPDECEVNPPGQSSEQPANRYISFRPDNGVYNVAFQLEMTDGPGPAGVLGWVGEPFEAGCPDDCSGQIVARIVDEPVFRVWDENAVFVSDCGIVPDAWYSLSSTGDGTMFSEPLDTVRTVLKPDKAWADVVGEKFINFWQPPDGFVNFDDIQATIQTFEKFEEAPPEYWVDIAVEVPDFVVNMTDVQMIVLAFEGGAYPYLEPMSCP